MINEDVALFQELNVRRNFYVAGRTGRPAYFEALVGAQMGGWFNAAKAQLTFSGVGQVSGMASAFNAEIALPNLTTNGGAHCALELNFNFTAATVLQANMDVPQAIICAKVGGHQTGIDTWEVQANAAAIQFTGLTAGNGKVFATGGNAASDASLKIMIGGTAYYIMLTTTPSTT